MHILGLLEIFPVGVFYLLCFCSQIFNNWISYLNDVIGHLWNQAADDIWKSHENPNENFQSSLNMQVIEKMYEKIVHTQLSPHSNFLIRC